jgi:hypothetical protein
MTDTINSKKLSGVPPGRCIHTPRKGHAMSNLSRRSLVSSPAALPALALPAVALARSQPDDDAVLRHLWSEYLVHAAAYEAAKENEKPARAAFDAEFPPCPTMSYRATTGAIATGCGRSTTWTSSRTLDMLQITRCATLSRRSWKLTQQGCLVLG